MLRILNSLSSCCDVEMFLQSNSVGPHKSCTFRWRTIAKVSLGGFRAFSDGPTSVRGLFFAMGQYSSFCVSAVV